MVTSEIDKSFLRPLKVAGQQEYRQESAEYWRAILNNPTVEPTAFREPSAGVYLYEFPGDLTHSVERSR